MFQIPVDVRKTFSLFDFSSLIDFFDFDFFCVKIFQLLISFNFENALVGAWLHKNELNIIEKVRHLHRKLKANWKVEDEANIPSKNLI